MASDFTWSKSLLYKYRFLLFPLLYFHMLFIILFLVKIILRFISLFCLWKHRWYKSPDRNPVFEKYLKQKPAKQQQRLRRHNKQRYFFITPVDTFSSLRSELDFSTDLRLKRAVCSRLSSQTVLCHHTARYILDDLA